MSISADTLRKLAELHLAPEQMAGVLSILADMAAADEARKLGQRDRVRRHREAKRDGNVTVTDGKRDSSVTPPSPSLPPQTPPSRPHPPAGSLREREGIDLQAEFDEEFWPRYPHKVGKPDAQRKFVAARRSARLPEIMAGLDRYIASKPADRPWCNPATWLNQARWADEPAAVAPSLRVVNGQGPPRTDRDRLMDVGRRMLAEERGEVDPPHWQGSTIDGQAHRRQ